jgi:ABC-type transport system involved in cytochrome c biogenesis ATPase subunit
MTPTTVLPVASLTVERFRQFERISLSGLKRVTLIGGRNNSGKTSVLEAAFLSVGGVTQQALIDLALSRRVPFDFSTSDPLWEFVFRGGNASAGFRVESTNSSGVTRFSECFGPTADDIRLTDDGRARLEIGLPGSGEPISLDHYLAVVTECPHGKDHVHESLIAQAARGLQMISVPTNYQETGRAATAVEYLSTAVATDTAALAEQFSHLRRSGAHHAFVESLRYLDADIESAEVTVHLGKPSLAVERHGMLVPLSYSGDGVVRLANLLIAISRAPGGAVLVDEVENGLHHATLDQFWTAVDHAAQSTGTQVIATTHSAECLQAAARVFEGRAGDFSYVRLDAIGGQLLSTSYQPDEVLLADRIHSEVR